MRERELAFAELMIPIVKGWSTEIAQQTASLGIQVHGGMGYIEESGAAQYLRDARITTIYEGTTGIQANDLIGRKIARDGGKALADVVDDDARRPAGARRLRARTSSRHRQARCSAASKRSRTHRAGSSRTTATIRAPFSLAPGRFSNWPASSAAAPSSGGRRSSPRGSSTCGGDGDAAFLRAKIATARHFADHCLTRAPGLRDTVVDGAAERARARPKRSSDGARR